MPNATYIIVPLLLAVDSLHFVFARLLLPHIAPSLSALYVLAIGTLQVGLFGLATRRLRLAVLKQFLWLFVALGLLVAAATNINYESVAFVDPGTASLLAQMGILFNLGFGLLWLRDHLTTVQVGGTVLTILGVFTITYQSGDFLRIGSLLVLSSAFFYALHTALTKRYADPIEFTNFFFYRLFATTAFLFLIALARGTLALPDPGVWPLLLLIGTSEIAISRTLYYLALRRLKLSLHTIILTLSPVATILWSLALFDIVPTPRQMLGGAAVLLGVMLVSLGQQRVAKPLPPLGES